MAKKLIDVSTHQGVIDWEKVKPHIDGAILRVGYGNDQTNQDDKQFKRNADECARLGIPFGVYIYSYADSLSEAKSEAAHALRLIKGYTLSYPVYLDLEESGTQTGAIERANVFGDIIEKAGYWCGIYANLHWWNNYLKGLDRFTKWVAQYNAECTYTGTHLDMWQYSSEGKIGGISGNVDMNYCYRDFPAEILADEATTVKKTVDELAQEVLAGKWGNGTDRKQKLAAAGYDADAVQKKVNELCAVENKPATPKAGDVVKLNKGKLYVSSTGKSAITRTGIFYLYDGKKVNGRYLVTNSPKRVGKTPRALNVSGWVVLLPKEH